MIIREAKPEDLNSILEVLRASLGETSSRKNEAVWNYKHVLNPFGKSLVLVAEENAEIIGVRAFMRWQWQTGEKVFSAFRAVDTATHPDHQGKGIFKKLTLKALDIAKESGDHFIFNTPNTLSKPGYIKMGWKEVGNLKVSISIAFNLRSKEFKYNQVKNKDGLKNVFFKNLMNKQKDTGKFFTPKDAKYLDWRFKNCKLQQYLIYEDDSLFIAAYLKKRKKLNELRVSECIALTSDKKNQARKEIAKMSKKVGANIITAAPGLFILGITAGVGPVLTEKNLNLSPIENDKFQNLDNWNYSLGDLELF